MSQIKPFNIKEKRQSAVLAREQITQQVLNVMTLIYPPFIGTNIYFGFKGYAIILTGFWIALMTAAFVLKKYPTLGKCLAMVSALGSVVTFSYLLPETTGIQLWFMPCLFLPFLFFDVELGTRRILLVATILGFCVQFKFLEPLENSIQHPAAFIETARVCSLFLSGLTILFFALSIEKINDLQKQELLATLRDMEKNKNQLRSQKLAFAEQNRKSAVLIIAGQVAQDLKPKLRAITQSTEQLKESLSGEGPSAVELQKIIQQTYEIHKQVQQFREVTTEATHEPFRRIYLVDLIKYLSGMVSGFSSQTAFTDQLIQCKPKQTTIAISNLVGQLRGLSPLQPIKIFAKNREQGPSLTLIQDLSDKNPHKFNTSDNTISHFAQEILRDSGVTVTESATPHQISIELIFSAPQAS